MNNGKTFFAGPLPADAAATYDVMCQLLALGYRKAKYKVEPDLTCSLWLEGWTPATVNNFFFNPNYPLSGFSPKSTVTHT